MANLKKLTIIHSNDLHGDFVAKEIDREMVGGVSMVSGYVSRARREDPNVLYVIAGDMFQGSLIDSEYKGISTVEIMNVLAPDVVTLGNHEVDYGIAHLLFLEKCASFPIINANLYLKTNYKRLFHSHLIKRIDGMKILFIGILTEEVLDMTRQDELLGTMVDVEDAVNEIGLICDAYGSTDIDFTVLLTHIGFEEDKKLAEKLDPRWGVDMIIGGHSHTVLTEPAVVNGIPIVTAGCGTAQLGRFDVVVDTDENCIHSYEWQLIPVNEEHCPRDLDLEGLIETYKNETDRKYARLLTRFVDVYTHPSRYQETSLGHVFSDLMQESSGLDLIFLGSGSIRKESLGPLVLYRDMLETFPFDDALYKVYITGAQLRRMLKYMLRDDTFNPDVHTEFYQLSAGIQVVYNRTTKEIMSLTWKGRDLADDEVLTVGFQEFHFFGIPKNLGITLEELEANGEASIVASSCASMCLESITKKEVLRAASEPRVVLVD